MARAFTLGTLVTRCQERCDMENATFIDSSEWKGYISSAYAKLHGILAATGLRYFESTQSISTASLTDNSDGGGYIALPSGYLSTIGVDYTPSGGTRYALYELMAQERNAYSGTGRVQAEAYALSGSNLVLYPYPPTGQTYTHMYIPQPTDYSSSADATNVDVVTPDGESFIIWEVAVMAFTKEGSTDMVAVARAEAKEAETRLRTWATLRSINTRRRRWVDEGPFMFDEGDYRRW